MLYTLIKVKQRQQIIKFSEIKKFKLKQESELSINVSRNIFPMHIQNGRKV